MAKTKVEDEKKRSSKNSETDSNHRILQNINYRTHTLSENNYALSLPSYLKNCSKLSA